MSSSICGQVDTIFQAHWAQVSPLASLLESPACLEEDLLDRAER